MNDHYDCPECHRIHDQPAEASAGFRAFCLDCYLDHTIEESGLTQFPAAA